MSMMRLSKEQRTRLNERGMVSIMVTMILMLVITLIVLGFAQISRRNQRQALDRQLSTQAFYAAETGVNDVHELIKQRLDAGNTVVEKTTCKDDGTDNSYVNINGSQHTLDAAAKVEYTCVMVDPNPTSLQYSDLSSTSSIVPIKSADGSNIGDLTLTWNSKANTGTPVNGCPTTQVFPPSSSWPCGYGVVRFDLVPTGGNGLNAVNLMQKTMTSFLIPFSSGGSTSIPYSEGTANTNNRVGVRCDNSKCAMTIQNVNSNNLYLRIASLYKSSSLQITGTKVGGAGTIKFEGAQAVIDSTGKAQDVLRRIQVRMPLDSQSKNELPDHAIQTTDAICKRFAVADGYFDSIVPGVNSTNPLCQP